MKIDVAIKKLENIKKEKGSDFVLHTPYRNNSNKTYPVRSITVNEFGRYITMS